MSLSRWHHAPYQTEALRLLFDRLLRSSGTSAVLTPDGRPLHVLVDDPVDLATLPHAAFLCSEYLKLKDGEIAAVNDPFAGGAHLGDVTFVVAVKLPATSGAAQAKGDLQAQPSGKTSVGARSGRTSAKDSARAAAPGGAETTDLLIARRERFAPRFWRSAPGASAATAGAPEAEALRVPPTPLGTVEKPNEDLLRAIAGHPSAPPGFLQRALLAIEGLRETAARFREESKEPASELRPQNFGPYLAQAQIAAHERLARLPLGRGLASRLLPSGETLKLAVETSDDKVIFDFAGSETSQTLQLTDRATFGACFSAVARAAGGTLDANAGSFGLIEVRSVPGAMVNARGSAKGIELGMVDLASAISELALEAFSKNRASLKAAQSSSQLSRWQFEFANGGVFSDAVSGGSGATSLKDGADAAIYDLKVRGDRGAASIELLERSSPIRFESRGPRLGSGGKGERAGGNGIVICLSVLEPCRFIWALPDSALGPKGQSGGGDGLPAEISLCRASAWENHQPEPLPEPLPEQFEKLASKGEMRLLKGDRVQMLTAGGGGFGIDSSEPAVESETKTSDGQ